MTTAGGQSRGCGPDGIAVAGGMTYDGYRAGAKLAVIAAVGWYRFYSACGMTVSDALASLNQDDRSVIVKAFYLAMSVTEIARGEDTSETAVKFRLHQAMHALRTAAHEQGVMHFGPQH
ncbi:MAG TPA: sigma factor-like helix-turn-helix DNA-binding protein [Mycobacterium sp.]|jgi:hypothetical protein|nr:sigma factor-like helix-turn-helix DNA-binding protein [Mycobacterium sp.]